MIMGAISALPKGVGERMTKLSLSDKDVDSIVGQINTTAPMKALSEEERGVQRQSVRSELAKFQKPTGMSDQDWERHLDNQKKLDAKEKGLRDRYNRELQAVMAKGDTLGTFEQAKRGAGIEEKYRASETASFIAEQKENVMGLTTSDVSMSAVRAKRREAEIRARMERDAEMARSEGVGRVAKSVSAAIMDSALAGMKLDNQGNKLESANINPSRRAQLEYLAGRQQWAAQNPEAFLKMAQDRESFGRAFIGRKEDVVGAGKPFGEGGGYQYDEMAGKLSTALIPQQDESARTLIVTQQITKEGLSKLQELQARTNAEIAEARFRELSGAIKGIDELSRGGARKLRRELRRDEYVLRHSRSAIRRGEAARDMLNYIPESERDYNNPMHRRLYDTAMAGSRTAFGYIYRGTSLEGYANSSARASARTFGQFKAANAPVYSSGMESPKLDTSDISASLKSASNDVVAFGEKLNSIGSSLDNLKNRIDQARAERQQEASSIPPSGTGGPPSPDLKPSNPFWKNMRQWGMAAGGSALTLGALMLMRGKGAALVSRALSPAAAGGGLNMVAGAGGGLASAGGTVGAAAAGASAAASRIPAGMVMSKAGLLWSATSPQGRAILAAKNIAPAAATLARTAPAAATTTIEAASLSSRFAAALAKSSPPSGFSKGLSDSLRAAGRGWSGEAFISRATAGQSAGAMQRMFYSAGSRAGVPFEALSQFGGSTLGAFRRGAAGQAFINRAMAGQSAGAVQRIAYQMGQPLARTSQAMTMFERGLTGSTNLTRAASGLGAGSASGISRFAFGFGRDTLAASRGAYAIGNVMQKTPLLGRMIGGKAGILAPIIGGAVGGLTAKNEGYSRSQGVLLGALTGGVERGSLAGQFGLVKRGGAADTALGFGGAAMQGAIAGGAVGSFVPVVGTAIGAGVGAAAGVTAEGGKHLSKALVDYETAKGNIAVGKGNIAMTEQKASFYTRNRERLKKIAEQGSGASDEDKKFFEGAKKIMGDSLFSNTYKKSEDKRVAEFFQSSKGNIGKNLISPVGTWQSLWMGRLSKSAGPAGL
jgi:hypothetical protein